MRSTHLSSLPTRLHRLLAVASAALVLALTIFAASPSAHDWLHAEDEHSQSEHGCPVVLLGGSVGLPSAAMAVPAPSEGRHQIAPSPAIEVFLLSPRYLRQPERGPPWVLSAE